MTAAYTFFEGNKGSQDKLGSIVIEPGRNIDLKDSNAPFDNDEARSVVLNNGVKKGSALVVYDDPKASMNDDWCVIQVKEDINDVNGYTVDSFEQDETSNDLIYQNYNKKNGLDGKVSYISIYSPWPVDWPIPPENNGTNSTTLFNHEPSNAKTSNSNLEPSGLTLVGSDLYMVSDNGGLSKIDLNNISNGWTTQHLTTSSNKDYGFESIAYVGDLLMLGVEGADQKKDQPKPQILCFDPTKTSEDEPLGQLTGSSWTLNDEALSNNAGMESMTFVPSSHCPTDWGKPSSTGYGGFFLVSLQTTPTEIQVYDLPIANGADQPFPSAVTTLTSDFLNLKMSDLSFDATTGRLYVLYDGDHGTIDALQIFALSSSGMIFENQTMPPIWPDNTPQKGLPVMNCEGITVNGNTVYLALDQNNNSLSNYVFQLIDFNIGTEVPVPVIPPFNCEG